MSEWNAYIVPLDDRLCRGKGPTLITYLESAGVIDGFYAKQHGWYAGADGPRFPNVLFEYLEVFDSDAAHFIPSGTSGG